MNEGIYHNGSTTFTLRTGQWEVDTTGTGTFVHVPPDSMLGVNFTVFGRLSESRGVTERRTPNPSTGSLLMTPSADGNMLRALFYSEQSHENMKLDIYDVLGRPVGTVQIGHVAAGWGSTSFTSNSLPSGAYVCRVSGYGYSASKSVLIVK